MLTARDHDPDEVHKEKVEPEVERLRSRISLAPDKVIESTSCIIQNVPIKLPSADQHLQRVSHRMSRHNHACHNQAARSPERRRHALHAQHERILRQVSAIAERVLFPELPKDCLFLAHVGEVHGIVAFEDQVNETREDEPHGREELDAVEFGRNGLAYDVGCAEKDGAGAEEDGEEVRDGVLVCDVAVDQSIERVVGVGRVGDGRGGIFDHVGGVVHRCGWSEGLARWVVADVRKGS